MKKSYGVAVVFGGISNENEISVITGTMVCNVLKKGGVEVLPVYIDLDGVMRAGGALADITLYKGGGYKACAECAFVRGGVLLYGKRGKPKSFTGVDCVLNCCHGGAGEGGALAGLIKMNGIPFASPEEFVSSAFMDKYLTKLILKGLGATVARYAYARDMQGAVSGAEELGYPVIVKPANLGSSIGIAKADNIEELKSALETAFELDGGVLIEEYLPGLREINCAAYYADGRVVVSPCEEVFAAGEVLSYDDKYAGGGRRVFPAELDGEVAEAIRAETKRVYSALNARGAVRFDFILSGGKVYISEVNTVPGSLSQYLLSGSYSDFYFVLAALIRQAKRDFTAARSRKVITTGILNSIKPAGGKGNSIKN